MPKDTVSTVCHRWILETLDPEGVAVDGTAGNGNDTLFLLQHFRKVYAFDIQQQAMETTLKRCADFQNLIFSLSGHEHLKDIVQEPIQCAVFNFGYLPHSDSSCITLPKTSVQAVQAALDLLTENGTLLMACYLGHPGGKEEHAALFQWIRTQTAIQLRSYCPHPGGPILYEVRKKHPL